MEGHTLQTKGCFLSLLSKCTQLYDLELLYTLLDVPCFRLVRIRS